MDEMDDYLRAVQDRADYGKDAADKLHESIKDVKELVRQILDQKRVLNNNAEGFKDLNKENKNLKEQIENKDYILKQGSTYLSRLEDKLRELRVENSRLMNIQDSNKASIVELVDENKDLKAQLDQNADTEQKNNGTNFYKIKELEDTIERQRRAVEKQKQTIERQTNTIIDDNNERFKFNDKINALKGTLKEHKNFIDQKEDEIEAQQKQIKDLKEQIQILCGVPLKRVSTSTVNQKHNSPPTVYMVNIMLAQLRADRAQSGYWQNKLDTINAAEDWLMSLQDHLEGEADADKNIS